MCLESLEKRMNNGLLQNNTPKKLAKLLPALGSMDGMDAADVPVPVKLFNPIGVGTWYLTEYCPETDEGFGLCDIHEAELGYVSLRELRGMNLPLGLTIERDIHWDAGTTLAQVKNKERF
jgi:hypothetical protein